MIIPIEITPDTTDEELIAAFMDDGYMRSTAAWLCDVVRGRESFPPDLSKISPAYKAELLRIRQKYHPELPPLQ